MKQKPEGNMDAELEAVLEAYADAEQGPSRATLVTWINRYPQFAPELTDFTARWQLLRWAGDADDNEVAAFEVLDEEQERMVLRGVSAAQSVFFAKRAAKRSDGETSLGEASDISALGFVAPIESLIAAAQRAGLDFAALKEHVGLSDALLQKLNRRLINPPSIPARIIADIATAIQQRVEAVSRYLTLAPTFAQGAQHRASQAPTLPKAQEDFFEAVRNDAALSPDRKADILALPRTDVSGASHHP